MSICRVEPGLQRKIQICTIKLPLTCFRTVVDTLLLINTQYSVLKLELET